MDFVTNPLSIIGLIGGVDMVYKISYEICSIQVILLQYQTTSHI